MTLGTEKRNTVISNELYEKLNLYLGFRHFFRHAYSFHIKWHKIKELVIELPSIYECFKQELMIFIKSLKT